MNLSAFILNQLQAWGIRHLYGVTGDAILPFMDAVARQSALRFIPVRHESAAGFMASAEAKLTGRPAVCLATTGPGLANLINGLGDACLDRVPLLVLSGQVETYKIGADVKQYLDQQALVTSLAGYSTLLAAPEATPAVLAQALRVAVGEGRVAHISVPKDLWGAWVGDQATVSLRPQEPYLTAAPVVPDPVLDQAASVLREARRPLVLSGHGARPAADALLQLADAWGAGIILALGGKGMLPDAHPLVLGGLGTGGTDAVHQALSEADMLLIAGSTWWPATHMPSHLRVVQIDRVPTNIGAKCRVECGLPGDSIQVIPALRDRIVSDPGDARSDWRRRVSAYKCAWLKRLEAETQVQMDPPPQDQVHVKPQDQAQVQTQSTMRTVTHSEPAAPCQGVPPWVIARALEQIAPPGSIITLDTSDILLWVNRCFQADGQRFLFSGTWRSTGFALPAASAAKLCEPETRVIALIGDGGLATVMGELAIPVQEGLDLTLVVVRNGVLALEEHKARSEGLLPFGHRLLNPDFAVLGAAFGWSCWKVERLDDLGSALKAAIAVKGPALVDVAAIADPSLHLSALGRSLICSAK